MALRQAPPAEIAQYETVWIGDESVDVEASDVLAWATTGEREHLKFGRGEPTVIAYTALTEIEHSQLPIDDGSHGAFFARCYEACRFGLRKVQGVQLRRQRYRGISALTDDTIRALTVHKAQVPIVPFMSAVYSSIGIRLDDVTDESRHEMSLPVWIGGQILIRTFRGAGVAR